MKGQEPPTRLPLFLFYEEAYWADSPLASNTSPDPSDTFNPSVRSQTTGNGPL